MAGRPESITTRIAELAMDVYAQAVRLATRDGAICRDEHELLLGIQKLRGDTERLDISRRIARTVEDAGALTPHALRLGRELERDLAPPILMLSPDYPRTTEIETETA